LPDSKYVNVSERQLGTWVQLFTLASLFRDCEAMTNLLCLVKGTIYREKTEIINPWGVRRTPQPSPK